ncbi:MAG: NAD(P)-dependent oxidoreductase [Candidatus Latescibacteria bacterium]|jgi:NAD+ dependent glucose-6-phosphate dehydrogenase|nr:NAD(P)-dependent oxidoreductase [Candidatus Latescibacterota bacterium]MBT5830751.1 NAD(P)-dependent oxidoreductase [Candidatus Latescibacterota bacterium]
MSDKKHILITGGAGFVAGMLREHWGDTYQLRLSDINPVEDLAEHETFVKLDITKLDPFQSACEGIHTVIHLAADRSPRADFYKTLLDLNIIGAYNAFHAAHEAGCKRIVFASSVNAILGYNGETPVEWDEPIFPTNVYGATKCWGEALGRVYSESHGLSSICVRLGSPRLDTNQSYNPDEPSMLISPRDTAQLFQKCVEVENTPFAIVHGVSNNKTNWMGLEETSRQIGYMPQDGTAI